MGSIKYEDDLSKESVSIAISYKGKEPFKIRRHVETILKTVLEIESSKFYLMYIGWDTTDGSFKAEWKAHRKWDSWTKFEYVVRCWGQQKLGDPEKNGKVKIKLYGRIITSYEYSNSIQKSLWWSYKYMFYDRNRSQAFEEGREYYFRILNEMKQLYGIYRRDENIAFH